MEAASLAWIPLGWRCAFVSEIDKAACALLAARYPDVPNLGDMTGWRSWPRDLLASIDVLIGGTPCQGFSFAGLRGSLSDDRSNLCLEFLELANAIDAIRRERGLPAIVIVWENVPGVYSTPDNAFGYFLGGLVGADTALVPNRKQSWTHAGVVDGPQREAAWITRDAQYFGLAQRRARCFVVASARTLSAPAVLFERESVPGNPAPRRQAREGIAGAAVHGVGRHGVAELSKALAASDGGVDRDDRHTLIPVAFKASHYTRDKDGAPADVAPPLSADADRGDQDTLVLAYGGNDTRGPIDASVNASRDTTGPDGLGVREDLAYTLEARAEVQAVAFAMRGRDEGNVPEVHDEGDTVSALRAESGGSTRDLVAFAADVLLWVVRRLTPRECERLQGAPEVTKHVILRVCSDLQNSAALAGTKNLKSPKFAWTADGRVLALRASNAESLFNMSPHALAKLAAVSVLIDLERGEVLLRRPDESPISASFADAQERFGLAVPGDVFVRLVAHMTSILASEIPTGGAASPQHTTHSIPRLSGSGCAVLCGRETSALAADVAKLTGAVAALKSTTSPDGGNSTNSGWTSATSSFCVVAAMSGFIPAKTHAADFYDLSIAITGGWTNIAYSGKKMMADANRYKMCGNSMPVPVIRWIGERIELVLEQQQREAA